MWEKINKIRIWKEHLEDLLNKESESSAYVIGWEMTGRRKGERRDEGIRRCEVVEAFLKVKTGKAPETDGVFGEMLKYLGDIFIAWMWKICSLAWEEGIGLEDWKSGLLVPLYKEQGEREV